MKKIVLLFSLITSLLLSDDYVVVSSDGKSLEIEADAVQIGQSGIVIHKISEDFETIVARVVVDEINEGKVRLTIIPYKDLEQDALPSVRLKPQKGDLVKLPWLYHRSLVIAPTLNIYNQLTQKDHATTFVNSDIFAAYLSQEGHPSPLKQDFKSFCQAYDIGLLQIAVKKELFSIDCNSFVVLSKKAIEVQEHTPEKPFYSRVKEINANWWGDGSDPIVDYDAYYLKLLGQ